MKYAILLLAAVAVGCGSAPATQDTPQSAEPSENQRTVDALDQRYEQHLKESSLPVQANALKMKEMLLAKTESLKSLEEAYKPLAEAEEPDVRAKAGLRVGQLYLNLACEVATLNPAIAVDDPNITAKMNEALEKQAEPLIQRGKDALDFAGKTNGGDYSAQAAEIAAMLDPTAVRESCDRTQQHWLIADRPVGAGTAEVVMAACNKLAAPLGQCRERYSELCADGRAIACYFVGELERKAGELDAARVQYVRACDLGDVLGCRAAAVVPAADVAAHNDPCKSGDAVACMQLGRHHGDVESLGKMCAANSVISAKGGADACIAGDAAACWQRAANLTSAKPYVLPSMKMAGVYGMGGLVGSLRSSSNEDFETQMSEECAGNSSWACVQLGSIREEAGKDPSDAYRKGCDLGNAMGCRKLASRLFDSKQKGSAQEAVSILHSSCAAKDPLSCDQLASRFNAGDGVSKSPACAVAYAWQNCTLDDLDRCDDVNRLFHRKKDE